LIAENLCLRQQLLVLQRRRPRPWLSNCLSALLDLSKSMVWWLASFAPYCETGDGVAVAPTGLEGLLDVAVGEGRSPLDSPKGLIRRMAAENRLWGQERIQAELARLGFKVSARTVAKYMRRVPLGDPLQAGESS
jgi:hypothetical protein